MLTLHPLLEGHEPWPRRQDLPQDSGPPDSAEGLSPSTTLIGFSSDSLRYLSVPPASRIPRSRGRRRASSSISSPLSLFAKSPVSPASTVSRTASIFHAWPCFIRS